MGEDTGFDCGGHMVSQTSLLCGAALAALLVLSAPSQAQLRAAAPPPQAMGDAARRDIRVPDSVPNISGTWLSQSSNRSIMPLDG